MSKIKPCPCGEIPKILHIVDETQGGKWAYVYGICCGDWHIEFRNDYHPIESKECMELALRAWNKAPRGESG